MKSENYLQTNLAIEAVKSLEFAARLAKEIQNDTYAWKWLLTTLHNAAQGYMVLALWNGNGLLAMPKESAKLWLDAYRNNTPYPADRLDNFLNLYSKCKKAENFNYCGSIVFTSLPKHNISFKELNSFRNDFIHFTPKSWQINLIGFPSLVVDVLELIEFFSYKTPSILWPEPSLKIRTRWACRSLHRTMTNLQY
jgi:hypothetical protein